MTRLRRLKKAVVISSSNFKIHNHALFSPSEKQWAFVMELLGPAETDAFWHILMDNFREFEGEVGINGMAYTLSIQTRLKGIDPMQCYFFLPLARISETNRC